MKIDQTKIQRNMLKEISLPQCNWYPQVAGKIVEMLLKIPPIQYDSTEEFRQRLIVEYWAYYDSLESMFSRYPNLSRKMVFQDWFMTATNPEHIRRACQWLCSPESQNGGGVITLKPHVREGALGRAEDKKATARSIKRGSTG